MGAGRWCSRGAWPYSAGPRCSRSLYDCEPRWDGPYLKREVPKDPLGNAYVMTIPGQHGDVDLMSYGKDGRPGGTAEAADIGNW